MCLPQEDRAIAYATVASPSITYIQTLLGINWLRTLGDRKQSASHQRIASSSQKLHIFCSDCGSFCMPASNQKTPLDIFASTDRKRPRSESTYREFYLLTSQTLFKQPTKPFKA